MSEPGKTVMLQELKREDLSRTHRLVETLG